MFTIENALKHVRTSLMYESKSASDWTCLPGKTSSPLYLLNDSLFASFLDSLSPSLIVAMSADPSSVKYPKKYDNQQCQCTKWNVQLNEKQIYQWFTCANSWLMKWI